MRQTSTFRDWIVPADQATEDTKFVAEAGRYHLYVAYICPWASRTLMARSLKGLEDVISVSIVNPVITDQGWQFDGFPGSTEDHINGATYMHELYTKADPNISGRATVPVLWDKKTGTIVNNESADIVRILNSGFGELANNDFDLYPEALQADIDALNEKVYPNFNNGVYRAGFATTQAAYDEAYRDVFATLEWLEQRLSDGRSFLFGDQFTEADIRLFVTLIRFDAAYHGIFKCNLHMLRDYRYLDAYVVRVLDLPGIRSTVNLAHIKKGYYSIKALNPTRIVPLGPDMSAYGLE